MLCKAQEDANIELLRCGRVSGSDVTCDLSAGAPTLPGGITRVIHSAGITPNANRPHDTKNVFHDGNVVGTQHLLDGLDPKTLESFVLISSASVYGKNTANQLLETAPLTPLTEYGKSKRDSEQLVFQWCEQHSIPHTTVRLPLVVGKNAPGSLGQLINAIQAKRFVIPGDGSARKSMVLADDVAHWITDNPAAHGIFNLTDQQDPSYAEICDTITEHLNLSKVPRIPLPIMMLASWAGGLGGRLLNKTLPYNPNVHTQLTNSLTFSSDAATKQGWKPQSVVASKLLWLPR